MTPGHVEVIVDLFLFGIKIVRQLLQLRMSEKRQSKIMENQNIYVAKYTMSMKMIIIYVITEQEQLHIIT